MCEYRKREDEMLQTWGLVDWSREQEIGLARGHGASDERDERGVGEVQDEERCRRVGRVSLKTRYCLGLASNESRADGATDIMHPTDEREDPISVLESRKCVWACLLQAREDNRHSRDRESSRRPPAKGPVLAWRQPT